MARFQFPELHDLEWMQDHDDLAVRDIVDILGCGFTVVYKARRLFRKTGFENDPRQRNEHSYVCEPGKCKHYAYCDANRHARFPCETGLKDE